MTYCVLTRLQVALRLAAAFLLMVCSASAADHPYSEWSYSRRFSLNTSPTGANVISDVAGFPVLIRLSTENFNFPEAHPAGHDIRFTDDEATPLPYEIESWCSQQGWATLWVLVPRVEGNSRLNYVTMHWGNASAENESSHSAVFGREQGFVQVAHMSPGCRRERYGSRGKEHEEFEKARSLLMPLFAGRRLSPGMYKRIVRFGRPDRHGHKPTPDTPLDMSAEFTISAWVRSPNHQWNYYAVTYDGSILRFYESGEEVDRTDFTVLPARFFSEFRLSDVARSPEWIRLCYENQRAEDRLVEHADVVIASGPQELTVTEGTEELYEFVVDFYPPGSGVYTVGIDQSVEPDDGVLSLVGDGGFESEKPLMRVVSATVSAANIGVDVSSYSVRTIATVLETGAADTLTTTIRVVTDDRLPGLLLPLTTLPDALPLGGGSADVLVFTGISGGDIVPRYVALEELNSDGNVVGSMGELVDDGTNGDREPNDMVYSGTFAVNTASERGVFLRASAEFDSPVQTTYSVVETLYVTRFPVETANMLTEVNVVDDPRIGESMLSNTVTLSFDATTPPGRIAEIVSEQGGTIAGTALGRRFFQIEIPTADATGVHDAINTFLAYSEVATAEPEYLLSAFTVTPYEMREVDLTKNEWYLDRIRAREAWVAARGKQRIGIIDTGIDTDPEHPDLDDKVDKGANVVDPTKDPDDDEGHGTSVAGLASAWTNNMISGEENVTGISWDSRILAVKSLNAAGAGTGSQVAGGINAARQQGSKVLNLSLGTYAQTSVEKTAIQDAVAAGAIVVAAAGNDGRKDPSYPASYDDVISVAATDYHDKRGVWYELFESNYGPTVDISAPGTNLRAARDGGGTETFGMTSGATPLVSGAVALVLDRFPLLAEPGVPVDPVLQILTESCAHVGDVGMGAGRLDLFNAVFNGGFEVQEPVRYVPRCPQGALCKVRVGSVRYWQQAGRVAFVPMFGGVKPWGPWDRGKGMACMEIGGGTTMSSIRQEFEMDASLLEDNTLTIFFEYHYLTTETPKSDHKNRIVAEFGSITDGWYTIYYLDPLNDAPLQENAPSARNTDFGYGTVAPQLSSDDLDLSAYPGQRKYWFSVALEDLGGTGKTAVLLDNVRFRRYPAPPPGNSHPEVPRFVLPACGSAVRALEVLFSWEGGDPDMERVEYEITVMNLLTRQTQFFQTTYRSLYVNLASGTYQYKIRATDPWGASAETPDWCRFTYVRGPTR